MSNRAFRAITFVLFTFTVAMSVLFMDSMPNHRVGDGDYDMWLIFVLFPVIFLLHGVLSGIVLEPSQNRLYFTTTLLMLFLTFFLDGLAIDGITLGRGTVCGLIFGVGYTTISIIGKLIYLALLKLLHAVLMKRGKSDDHCSEQNNR